MSDNIPPSQMLRVPTPLVDVVKELSRLHRAGYTSAVLTGLQQLIASVDSSVDIDINSSGNKIDTALIAKLISSQLEPLQLQLEQSVEVLVAKYLTDHSENLQLRTGDVLVLIEPLHRRLSQVDQRLQLVESKAESAVISTKAEKPAVVHESKDFSPTLNDSDNLSTEVEVEEPAASESKEAAITAPNSLHLNRQRLGKYFGKSHETIRQWELNGELQRRGWVPVPDTGSSPKNPRLYRPIAPKSVDVSTLTTREISEHRRSLETDGRLHSAKQGG